MSTRSYVALAEADGYREAIYVHSDGYPSGRGPVLFDLAERHGGDLHAMWATLDQARRGGWSYLDTRHESDPYPDMLGNRGAFVPHVGCYYSAAPEESSRATWTGTEMIEPPPRRAGGPLEWEGWLFIEWVYAIDPDHGTLTIFTGEQSGPKAVAVVRFGDEVDWEAIEDAEVPA